MFSLSVKKVVSVYRSPFLCFSHQPLTKKRALCRITPISPSATPEINTPNGRAAIESGADFLPAEKKEPFTEGMAPTGSAHSGFRADESLVKSSALINAIPSR